MSVVVELAVIAAAAVAVAVCVARLSDRPSPPPPRGHPARPAPSDQLVRLERLVGGARARALHVHAYLRPMLTEIASHRLAARGRSLERLSDQDGRELLGEGLWDIVRPDRPFPSDRNACGVSSHELDAMLAVLERL